ncbi:MAG: dCTP deaminase [Novosphingobium sp.]|nr:dCTP deaminase [Novosphingobium sp.]
MTAAFIVDSQFEALHEAGSSVVRPFDESAVQPASIDLRLGNTETVYEIKEYVLGQDIPEDQISQRQFQIRKVAPGETVFVTLKETIRIPADCLGFVFPRSSITRLGIAIPPVFMNPGYEGQLLLTIKNTTGIEMTIMPDVRVAQLICANLAAFPSAGYAERGGKYAGEAGSASLIASDADIQEAVRRILESSVPDSLRGKI